mmetsp:Transcript_6672/g.13570  ORF Transcript_6672/g.13570 Transcript_6672/m.13570 type:complete len:93 (-) Transcript_6672:882-1160(-)
MGRGADDLARFRCSDCDLMDWCSNPPAQGNMNRRPSSILQCDGKIVELTSSKPANSLGERLIERVWLFGFNSTEDVAAKFGVSLLVDHEEAK